MTEFIDRFTERVAKTAPIPAPLAPPVKPLAKPSHYPSEHRAAHALDGVIDHAPEDDLMALERALNSPPIEEAAAAPLFVEIEGCLVRERSVEFLISRGWGQLGALARCLLALPSGRAAFKRALAKNIAFDPAQLPYNENFLEWLWGERETERPIWLLTSADEIYARKVANYLGLFDGVIASTPKRTIRGDAKLTMLRKKLGLAEPFDYCGSAIADLNLFAGARYAVLVAASADVQRHAGSQGNVTLVFD
jgi:hypothetical protein